MPSRILDRQTGEVLASVVTKDTHEKLAVNRDGTRVGVGTPGGEIWVDSCDSCAGADGLLRIARLKNKRQLTPDERKQYLQ
jgi:hypothetical protein